jgi:hypothetical protein
MPKFKATKEQNAHLTRVACSYRFDSFPSNPIIEKRDPPPTKGPVHCAFMDSEGQTVAIGYGNNPQEAFDDGFDKIRGAEKPKTKGQLQAELAAARAELAALRAQHVPIETPSPADTETKRGRGRPPGAKNKPKDEGAGDTTQEGDTPAP